MSNDFTPAIGTSPGIPGSHPDALTTDADFRQAEAELQRLLTRHNDAGSDAEGDELASLWQPIHAALLAAKPSTPLQAAIILRRLMCPDTGLSKAMPEDHHAGTIGRVIGFLNDCDDDARDVLARIVVNLEVPLCELRQGLDTLDIIKIGDDKDGGVIAFIERGLHASLEQVEAVYADLNAASQAERIAA